MSRDPEQLLNIKQAAELLNVSEISLRRWTNEGRLACRRVGGRRERRFRRQDLLDFLENLDRRVDDAVLVGGVPVWPGWPGAPGLGLVGAMVWRQARRMAPADLIACERRVDQSLLKRFPIVAVCQYDAREFSGLTVLSALKCHSDMFRQPLARFLG